MVNSMEKPKAVKPNSLDRPTSSIPVEINLLYRTHFVRTGSDSIWKDDRWKYVNDNSISTFLDDIKTAPDELGK